jgi:hypothetical protein
MQLQPSDPWQRSQRHTLEKRQPLQQMILGKLAINMQKIKSRPLFSHLVQKSTLSGSKILVQNWEHWNYYRKNRENSRTCRHR